MVEHTSRACTVPPRADNHLLLLPVPGAMPFTPVQKTWGPKPTRGACQGNGMCLLQYQSSAGGRDTVTVSQDLVRQPCLLRAPQPQAWHGECCR